jgi:ketosteroid isomerase-like protein
MSTRSSERASERSAKAWGDTAVVTALLHAKGKAEGKAFEYRVWYSDTYVRFADGWRYVFGQSSLPLPSTRP